MFPIFCVLSDSLCARSFTCLFVLFDVVVYFILCFLNRYDFSEAQFGKDVCDRIISPLKSTLRRYCDEGHDIMCAADMYTALEARPVKGTTAAVCELDLNQRAITNDRIVGFSSFHNFAYRPEGLVVWQAYGIGAGKVIKWEDLNISCRGLAIAKNVSSQTGFSPISPRCMRLPNAVETISDTDNAGQAVEFECKEPGCPHSFSSLDAVQDHTCFGEHRLSRNKAEGLYDKIRRDWAHKFSTLSLNHGTKSADSHPKTARSAHQDWTPEARGWALQKPRGGGTKFSENVKAYLRARFDTGVQTGRKADPNQVSKDMRAARNLDGTRKFNRDEWLTKTQIRSFFSRLAAMRRKQTQGRDFPHGDEADEDDEQLLEDEMQFLVEKRRLQFIEKVLEEVGVVHPIMYDGYNICQQVQQGKLSRFKANYLRKMCEYFELSYKARDTKALLTEKIKEMVMECGCSLA